VLQEERHRIILSEIEKRGAVKVTHLAQALDSSESTIRRDINELDKEGKLCKVFGGAIAMDKRIRTVEEDAREKAFLHVKEKEAIARYAAALIEDNDFVFLDSGTTTEHMIDFFHNDTVTYVTNGIIHGQKLAQRGFKVYMTGGNLKSKTLSIVGESTVRFIEKCNFTKCFMGASGIDIERGLTTADLDEAQVKEAALKHSYMAYVLADSSKFGVVSAMSFGRIEDCSIITNRLEAEAFKQYTTVKEVDK